MIRFEHGRYVADDGTVLLTSLNDEAIAQVAETAAGPLLELKAAETAAGPLLELKDLNLDYPNAKLAKQACGTGLRGIRCLRQHRQAPAVS